MSQNIALLCSRLNKFKAPKEVTSALNDPHDFMAFINMKSAVSLRDPDRVLLGTLAGEVPTDINLMNVGIRKPLPLLIQPLNSNSLGGNSIGAVLQGVDGAPSLVSPSLPNTSPINDNCTGPTSIQATQVQLDQRVVQDKS